MSDKDQKNKPQNNKDEEITDINERRALKKFNADGQWNIIQQVLQEIMATYLVQNPESMPASNKLKEDLEKEVKKRYAEDEDYDFIVKRIPRSDRTIRSWTKKDGWDEAVWGRIKSDGLFSSAKRAAVIEAIRQRAMKKSDSAAKLWLTMSGDYQEKMDVSTDKAFEKYRELNELIHKKKESD